METGFRIPLKTPDLPTYYHFTQNARSTIDMFLLDKDSVHLTAPVEVEVRSPVNTGPHDPVCMDLTFTPALSEDQQTVRKMQSVKQKTNWKCVDIDQYRDMTHRRILQLGADGFQNMHPEILVTSLNKILLDSSYRSTSRKISTKRRSNGKPWSKELKPYVKASKQAHSRWKEDPTNPTLATERKSAKKLLRTAQRTLMATIREEEQSKIMEASEYNKEDLFKLVAKQRKDVHMMTTVNFGATVTSQIDGWKTYFQNLASPSNKPEYDQVYKDSVDLQMLALDELYCDSVPLEPVTSHEVKKHVRSLKNGKAPDGYGISAEHLKNAAPIVFEALAQVTNNVLSSGKLVPHFKNGVITPVLKPNKPATNPDSYRRITVCSLIGKAIEKEVTKRLKHILDPCKSKLQFGFSEGCSPVTCALVVTESIAEALDNDEALYITYMDVRKAFDTVWHGSMLLSLQEQGVEGTLWRTMRDMYTNITSQVKLNGNLSDQLEELQGIRQGGLSSTELFKSKSNYLLDSAAMQEDAYRIGAISVGAPTTADDTALISSTHVGAQTLLGIAELDSNYQRYDFNAQKTKVMVINHQQDTPVPPLRLNNSVIAMSNQERHLGIERTANNCAKETITHRISSSRRAMYKLSGAGFYGLNGVGPKVTYQLLKIYIIPILTYGLESLVLNTNNYKQLELFFKSTLRKLQHLPDSTASPAIYLLLGAIPLEGQIHVRMLTLFGNIIRRQGTVEYEIIQRQLACKDLNSHSWVTQIRIVLARYGLPSAYALVKSPPTKSQWKITVNKTVHETWMRDLKDKAQDMTSLEYLDLSACHPEVVHSVWQHGSDPLSAHMATVKARLTVQRYPLGYSHFAGKEKQPLCTLCSESEETLEHFILSCPVLEPSRTYFVQKLESVLAENNVKFPQNAQGLLTLILMTSTCVDVDVVPLVEDVARRMIYKLHCRRSGLLGSTINFGGKLRKSVCSN
jgi:hypothetical protein